MSRLLATLLIALIATPVLASCGDGSHGAPSPAATSGQVSWKRLSDLPLSPRSGPVVVHTDLGIVAVGGDVGDPCPPNADCALGESAADGAILDPSTGIWQPIAPAPRTIPAYTGGVVADGHVFVLVDGTLLDYDPVRDRWRTISKVSRWYGLEADGRRLLLVRGSDEGSVEAATVLTYDVPTGRWAALPPDPIGKAYDRTVTPTDAGLVMTAHPLVPDPGAGDHPTYLLAARYDERTGWTRLPDATDMLGGGRWAYPGPRMVAVALDSTNGGGDPPGDYGRLIPFGGRLDPATGIWSRLPHAPEYLSGGWVVDAVGGPVIAAEGWVYDDDAEAWTRVPRPVGAPQLPGSAVWIGRTLYVVGGIDDGSTEAADAYDSRVWSWEVPAG